MSAVVPQARPDTVAGPPHFFTRLVGREDDLLRLESVLVADGARLVSLVGPGGVGKTRLAGEVAHAVEPFFEDGVVWCELVSLSGQDAPSEALARLLGLHGSTVSERVDAITQVLAPLNMLVVLDNCEHVIAAVGDLASALVERCPAVTILTTSRERLAVAGERVHDLRPLMIERFSTDVANGSGESAAVQLFADRAGDVGDFVLGSDNLAAVTEIVALVDGLPLGIELAAARSRTLGVAQIADELRQRLSLLDGALRTSDPRHRSLVSALEWSYDLLDPDERSMLDRLSVFRGPFSLEAAVAVGTRRNERGEPIAPSDVMVDRLQQLVDKSMVQADGADEVRHFSLLDSVRRFGEERLVASGQLADARHEHLSFYRRLVERVEEGLRGPEQLVWVGKLEAQADNLRAAVEDGIARGADGDLAALTAVLDIIGRLFWYLGFAGAHGDGRRWGEAALALVTDELEEELDPEALGGAVWTTGANCWLVGDNPAALEWTQRALEFARRREAPRALAGASMMMSRLQFFDGDVDEAIAYSTASNELFLELGDEHRAALGRSVGGVCLGLRGEFDAAIATLSEIVEIYRSFGDDYFLALTAGDLGNVHYFAGDVERAVALTSEAVSLARGVGTVWIESGQLTWLAELERYRGNPHRAAGLLEEVVALSEAVGGLVEWGDIKLHLGLVRAAQGETGSAAALLSNALEEAFAKNVDATVAASLEALAGVAEDLGRTPDARTFAAAAVPHRERAGPPRTPATRADLDRIAHLRVKDTSSHDPIRPRDLVALARDLADSSSHVRVESPWAIRVLALGPTEVYRQDRLLTPADWTYAKPKQVLFFLLEAGSATKEEIGLAIWPEASRQQLTRNLRSALYHLRNALGDRRSVVFANGRYAVQGDGLWYDVAAFEAALEAAAGLADGDDEARVAQLAEAAALYRGDFVLDLGGDDWAESRRAELRRRWVREALMARAVLLSEMAAHEQGVEGYRAVIEAEPLNDDAHLGLMRSLAALGDRSAALGHHEEMVSLYVDELGVRPSGAVAELAERLRSQGG